MAELAVKANYEGTGVAPARSLLRLTFPVWGIAMPIISVVGFSFALVGLIVTPTLFWTPQTPQVLAVLFTCSALSLLALTITRILSNNALIVDKGGIRMPLLPDQPGNSMRYLSWCRIKKLDVLNFEKEDWKKRCLVLYKDRGRPVLFQLNQISPQVLEQILIGFELWSTNCEISENVATLRSDIKLLASGADKLTYTDMWEEELRRRYCPTSFIPLEPGRTLKNGSLKVRRHLALGGLAAVYLCERDEKDLVVLKEAVIPEDAIESVKQKAREMFEREARFLMALDHPGIVKVLDYFNEGGRNYLMLQYLNGQDIRQFIKQNGAQREHKVIDWGIKIASILKYLHEQEPPIIHRDLTPDNLVITEDGSIVIIDFGAANEFIGQATGTLVGKQAYIAPEQFRGKATVESDIYAFGCTLYFMLTGQEPEALSESNPGELRPDLSPEICELVECCTQMEYENRYRSAAQLIPVLRRLSASQASV